MTSTNSLPPRLRGDREGSFAYRTITKRLPVILTRVINDVSTHITSSAATQASGKRVLASLVKLRYEMERDRPLQLIEQHGHTIDDVIDDAIMWNVYLTNDVAVHCKNSIPSWLSSPWMIAETWLYRSIRAAFECCGDPCLFTYDPFSHQKHASVIGWDATVRTVVVEGDVSSNNESEFSRRVRLSLWGNKADLSLRPNLDCSSLQVSSSVQLSSMESYILANDLSIHDNILWSAVCSLPDRARIDIVLDNAGFELFTDLYLADWLISSGVASLVVLHVKRYPWFVSDALRSDIDWVLEWLQGIGGSIETLTLRWRSYIADGKWKITDHMFWTTYHDFNEMERVAPELYSSLAKAALVFFKGDLNYRKLAADREWPHETPVEEMLQGFRPTALCILRTLKAELCCGLTSEAVAYAEAASSHSREWLGSGEYAVIHYVPPLIHCK